jgi:hypothetical protein
MKPKLSLEDTMNQLKARLEESEYKHSLVCEALENLLDAIDSSSFNHMYYSQRKEARKVLNGISDDN